MEKFAYQVGSPPGRFAPPPADAGRWTPRTGGRLAAGIRPDSPESVLPACKPRGRVRSDDIIFFATQLAVMVDTGVPLSEALDAIADQSENEAMRALVGEISKEVKGGVEFSACLERRPKHFGRLFTALMKASEASGTMGQMLQRLSGYLQSDRETRKHIKGAMVYPACMLAFCVVVVTGMLVFVLPRFETIYASKDVVLPMPTRLLLSLSMAIITYWPLFVLGLAGLGVGLWFYLHSERGKVMIDRLHIYLPIIGPMYRKASLARSLRAMSTMSSAGVSVLDALAITAQVAGNSFYAAVWMSLADGVQEGSSLSDQLLRCKLIPRTVTQMVSAGERTGRLGMVMDRVAEFCEADLKVAVKTVTAMVEPIMIVIMGAVIGAIALALLLPILSMSRVIAPH